MSGARELKRLLEEVTRIAEFEEEHSNLEGACAEQERHLEGLRIEVANFRSEVAEACADRDQALEELRQTQELTQQRKAEAENEIVGLRNDWNAELAQRQAKEDEDKNIEAARHTKLVEQRAQEISDLDTKILEKKTELSGLHGEIKAAVERALGSRDTSE